MKAVPISVVVPVYNVELYLEQCLKSIMSQSFQDFELILVDDGSSDNSGKICDLYEKQYPNKIRVIHKANHGLISARRVGIEHALGEFCTFVDSDDFVESNLLDTVNSYLCNNDVDVLLYSFQYYRNEKKEGRLRKVFDDGCVWEGEGKKEIYERLICTADITSIWTKAIRTSILKADPTDYTQYYDRNMAEDLLQSLYPLTVAKKIMYADKALYNYRINENSISRSFRPETIEKKNTLHVYEKILEYLPVWGMDNSVTKEKLSARWFNEAMYTMSNYYEGAFTRNDKRIIIDYDWETLFPKCELSNENKYVNKKYKELFCLLKDKKSIMIECFFIRKRWNQMVKGWKKGIKACIRKRKLPF